MKWFLGIATLLLILIVTSVLVGTAADLQVNGGTVQEFLIHTEIPCITATVVIEPQVLHNSSDEETGEQIVRAFIELPPAYDVEEILPDTVRLSYDLNENGVIEEGEWVAADSWSSLSCGDVDYDGIPDLTVTFNTAAVINILQNPFCPEQPNLTFTGGIAGGYFSGSCDITLVD